jgi:RNA polymerase sigma factor (sigma-70 family)
MLQGRIPREIGKQAPDPQPEAGSGGPPSDGRLLEHFVKHRDEDAFAELVTRHGPYILGVCRRVTAHPQDAEDVFQACFLELVRRAASILKRESVAGWLQTVAIRLARRARARRVRRPLREATRAVSEAVVDAASVSWREVRQVLEEEMARLPEDLRSAVIVCLFEGRTQEEAGQILNVPPRTLKDRVRRGRELLRGRLTRRGITLAVMGTLLSGGEVEALVPPALRTATLRGAAAVVNKTPLAGTVSPSALTLACSTGLAAGGAVLAAVAVAVAVATALAASSIAGHLARERAGAGAGERPMQTIQESFRGGRFNRELLRWSGPTPENFIRLEPEGLRITLPSRDGPAQPLGIALRPAVRGDFELEATFELLNVARPGEQRGAGLTVYFFMDDEEWNGLYFGKMDERVRGPAFVTGHLAGDRSRGEERVSKFTDTVAARDGSGTFRLRVVRRGATFRFFAADGETGELRHLQTLEVSDEDVRIVRFAADPGWSPNVVVDGRLVEFTMRAEEFVGYPAHGQ